MNKRSLLMLRTASVACLGIMAVPVAGQGAPQKVTEVSFDLGGRYDSNVARSSRELAQQRDLQQSDYVVTPSVTVDVVRPFGRSSAYIRGSVGYNFHANNSELDREAIALLGGGTINASICRLTPEIGFQRRQSNTGDILLFAGETPDLTQTVRNAETVLRVGTEVSCGRNFGLRPLFGIAYETSRNSDLLRDRAEYDSIEYTAGLQYAHPTQGTLTAFATRREVELPNLFLPDGSVDEYNTKDFGLRYQRDIGTRLQVNGSIAYSDLNSRNPLVNETSGLIWDIGATALLGERLQLTASTGRQFSNAVTSDATFNVSKPNSLRFNYASSDRLQFDGGIAITDRRFEYGFVPLGDFIENDTRRVYDVGATLRSGERLRYRLFAGYEEGDANGTLFDYNSTFVGLSVGLVL